MGGGYSVANGINETGQVVGYSTTPERSSGQAFITGPNGVGMTDLGTLTVGVDDTRALGINDAGQVVGYSGTYGGWHHAFITGPDGTGMVDLTQLLTCRTDFSYRKLSTSITRARSLPLPPSPSRRSMRCFLGDWALSGLWPGGEGAENRRAEMVKESGRWLDGLEHRLEDREWIACADFTVADILLATVLREVRKTDLIDPYPRLKAYYARALARLAWQRTLGLHAEPLCVTVADIR